MRDKVFIVKVFTKILKSISDYFVPKFHLGPNPTKKGKRQFETYGSLRIARQNVYYIPEYH